MKKVILSKLIIAVMVSIFLFGCSNNVKRDENAQQIKVLSEKEKVDLDKSFEIEFNERINKENVNEDTIYIISALGDKIDCTYEIKDKVVILKPKEEYQPDSKYYICVKNIKDSDDRSVSQPFKIKFTTKDKENTESSVDEYFNETELITLINKWLIDLDRSFNYKSLTELHNACINDPEINNISEIIKKDVADGDIVSTISKWAKNNIVHTQGLSQFRNEPGKDPWGSKYGCAVYKTLTPSEMKAMEVYTGRYTGKCTAIARFVCSLMRNNGLEQENYFLLAKRGHTICLFKYNDEYYKIDNNRILKINDTIKEDLYNTNFIAFYHEKYSYSGNIKISDSIFNSEGSFIEQLLSTNNLDKKDIYTYEENLEKQRYTQQSLDVHNPNIYLKASLLGPRVNELSKELRDEENIVNWIKNNIGDKRVLKVHHSILTADQTVVFKNGSSRDKGLLMTSLLYLNGNKPELIITEEDVYVVNDNNIYSMNKLEKVKSIEGEKNLIITK
ncbi:Ig-like domain-containing protein [Oceanirhabdus sp. W0125-5]|uniref:Ig-like domain-containing protein n=1 Tax=Oceanirhabdus sp. W0125-5 TaxID=2999116 RepID=UPI0022F32804|nr:Ig-like domain-containing protein [Oceanirhabdus sp. W0125-5]WBW97071.1 Ig-like domain-containing protein [Oceanirhabdus sp. W0125-5]